MGRRSYSGNNYEEKGRLFLAVRGQMTRVVGGRPPIVISTFGDADELGKFVTDDWNSVHLIVRGNVATHIVNGHLMTVVVDDDPPNRPTDGAIGMQVHVGRLMKNPVPEHPVEELVAGMIPGPGEGGVATSPSRPGAQCSTTNVPDAWPGSPAKVHYSAPVVVSKTICRLSPFGLAKIPSAPFFSSQRSTVAVRPPKVMVCRLPFSPGTIQTPALGTHARLRPVSWRSRATCRRQEQARDWWAVEQVSALAQERAPEWILTGRRGRIRLSGPCLLLYTAGDPRRRRRTSAARNDTQSAKSYSCKQFHDRTSPPAEKVNREVAPHFAASAMETASRWPRY